MEPFYGFTIQELAEGCSVLSRLDLSAHYLNTCHVIPEPPKTRRGPKEKIPGIKRVDLPARILPGTRAELERRQKQAEAAGEEKSLGELVDEAVAGTQYRYSR
jgi:hypothetical protein